MAGQMVERRRDPLEAAALRDRKPKPKPKPAKHVAAIAAGPIDKVAALMFWKLRNQFPEFAMTLDERDIKGFDDSFNYQEQTPQLIVEAIRVSPDKPTMLVIRIADRKSGDLIRVSENNEADLDIAEAAKKVRRVRESAPNLVNAVRGEFSQGITSQESIMALCDAVMTLARA